MPLGISGWNATWRFTLVTLAARICGVEAVALRRGTRRLVKICGSKAEVVRGHDLYQRLLTVVRELEVMVATDGRSALLATMVGDISAREISDSFRRGVVAGMVQLYSASRKRKETEVAGGSPPAAEAGAGATDSGEVCRALVRVRSLVAVGAEPSHAGRVRERYAPETRPIDIVGCSNSLLFELGYSCALAELVLVGDDAQVRARRRR